MDFDRELKERFIETVREKNANSLDALLSREPGLRSAIDECWFDFDSPAVVFVKQNEALVKVLLKHGADINQRTQWWAGSFGVLDGVSKHTADFLIKRGARLDIHSAAQQGEFDLVQEFIDRDRASVNARGGDGKTPLHVAADVQICSLLIESGAEVSLRCLDHSATAAQYSVKSPDKCRCLVEAGAMPDVFMAVALGDREMLELVIRDEPDCLESVVGRCPHTSPVDPRSSRHVYFWELLGAETPLEVARNFDQSIFYEEIFDRSPPMIQFLAACWEGRADQALAAKSKLGDPVGRLNGGQRQLLTRAAWEGKGDAVRLMLELGFDPHVTGEDNSTPLDRASFHGSADIVQVLLQADPNPPLELKNQFGSTPLSCCAYGSTHSWKKESGDHLKTAELLIDAGAQIDAQWLPIENKSMDALLRSKLRE